MSKLALTKRQRSLIDDLLAKYPQITPDCVNAYYQPSYVLSYRVYIEKPDNVLNLHVIHTGILAVITRCEHRETAWNKTEAIRDYIAAKQGGAK